jgi:hypothetical protein
MKPRVVLSVVLGACLVLGLAGATAPTLAQDGPPVSDAAATTRLGSGFSYQGRLTQNSAPVTASCDFEFTLWDAVPGGAQQGAKQTRSAVQVSQGLFTITALDFDTRSFQGDSRWLEIGVRCPAGSGAFTTLSPRQPLLATPYALSLQPGADIIGNVLESGGDTSVLKASNTNDDLAPDGAYGPKG